jgi:flavin reductase (DIM6/NTAB) family NADH-FMN oxidoreductase RutF
MSFHEINAEALAWNPFTQIGKGWVLVGAGNEKAHNAMTVSWGGLGVWWGKNVATVYIRESRYTKTFLDTNECFTVSALPEAYRKEMGFFGSHSGRDGDKFAETGLTPYPIFGTVGVAEADVILVCKKLLCTSLPKETFVDASAVPNWYAGADEGNFHTMYIGEIVKVLQKD